MMARKLWAALLEDGSIRLYEDDGTGGTDTIRLVRVTHEELRDVRPRALP